MMILTLMILALIPAFYSWRKEMRLRHLAEARRDIAIAVTRMETLMLNSGIQLGAASHDALFKHMQRVQYSDCYDVDWKVLKEPSKRVADLAEKLHAELAAENCQFSENMRLFIAAYFKAFRSKHPFVSFGYILYLHSVKGGLKCALLYILSVLFILKLSLRFLKPLGAEPLCQPSEQFFSQSKGVWLRP